MAEKQTQNTVFLPVTVKKRIAVYHAKEKLICGNSLYAIRFDFDSEWASYPTKTAQFRYRKEDGEWVKHATLFDGTDCPVPPIPYAKILYIGVYAGDITTSTEAAVPCLLSALSHGGQPEEPETNVYNQIMEKLNEAEKVLKDYPETEQAASEAVRYTPMDLTDDQKRTARENIDAANEIAVTATGEELVITDAAEQPLRDLSIIGKSRQINTPSPDAHATIATVGSVGYTDVSFNDEFFKFPSVDGGLRGIPVEDGGNYTDESGQQWVSDEIRYTNNRVVHTRRIGHVVLDGNSAVSYDDVNRCFLIAIDGLSSPSTTCLCNAFVGSAKDPVAYDIAVVSGGLMIHGTVFNEDDDALKEYLTVQAALGTPVEVIYILSEPVEAVLPRDVDYLEYLVLTDEENVIFSDDGAGLSVEYIADTRKYVDQHGGGGGGGITKETDPTVPAWAKASKKPTYTKSEVGLGNVDNVKQYSASNPPPYPVASVNEKTGAVQLSASDVGAATMAEVQNLFTSETWTFTLADGSTVEKKVALL